MDEAKLGKGRISMHIYVDLHKHYNGEKDEDNLMYFKLILDKLEKNGFHLNWSRKHLESGSDRLEKAVIIILLYYCHAAALLRTAAAASSPPGMFQVRASANTIALFQPLSALGISSSALVTCESIVHLAESLETSARIASESARKLMDKMQAMQVAAVREEKGFFSEQDFDTY
jgi:hypothetical protein